MDEKHIDGGPAFPHMTAVGHKDYVPGMSLRQWFEGQALANSAICSGQASEYDLNRWFGNSRSNITKAQIVAAQARDIAVEMMVYAYKAWGK